MRTWAKLDTYKTSALSFLPSFYLFKKVNYQVQYSAKEPGGTLKFLVQINDKTLETSVTNLQIFNLEICKIIFFKKKLMFKLMKPYSRVFLIDGVLLFEGPNPSASGH